MSFLAFFVLVALVMSFLVGYGVASTKLGLLQQHQGRKWLIASSRLFHLQYQSIKYYTRDGTRHYSSSNHADFINSETHYYNASLSTLADTQSEMMSHLYVKKNKLSDYWLQQLARVRRPAAQRLLKQVVTDNELGFEPANDPKKGTLLKYVLDQKKKYADKVLLVRVGEFYESFGIDALLLVNYCGLNAMGKQVRAGCPLKNVQQTLDCLTENGLSVAVFEEINDVDMERGPSKTRALPAKIKNRALTQIVSPSSSTYMYDLCLRSEDIEWHEGRPFVSIFASPNGYSINEIYTDQRVIISTDRLSKEGISSLIDCVSPAGFFVQGRRTDFSFIDDSECSIETSFGYSEKDFHENALYKIGNSMEVNIGDFRTISRSYASRPKPLYTTTAMQIGLLPNPNIPDLINHILPPNKQASSKRFFRRWLLNPPSYQLADQFQRLCRILSEDASMSLPQTYSVPVSKVISLLLSRQCNSFMFRDICSCVEGVISVLQSDPASSMYNIMEPMSVVTSYEAGFKVDINALLERSLEVQKAIHDMIISEDDIENDQYSNDVHERVPAAFFTRNENEFRGCVLVDASPDVRIAYETVSIASKALCDAIDEDFPDSQDVVYDIHNNLLMFKEQSNEEGELMNIEDSVKVVDRNKKVIPRRFTTQKVSQAIATYIQSCEEATRTVLKALQTLSDTLYTDITTIVQCSHWSIILEAASSHTSHAKVKGWSLPHLQSHDEGAQDSDFEHFCEFVDLIPFWLDRFEAVSNSFTLKGMFLLSAPNMSGKSTLMRSIIVATLLGNCGMFAPVSRGSSFRRYDNFFFRSTSYDVPASGMSSFALEMDDLRVILRDCSNRSLVMIDEIGRGTSSRDGASIAGALLEHLDQLNTSGVFSTHLHEIFQLPLRLRRVSNKRMGQSLSEHGGNVEWTYHLENGICEDSLALHTAQLYGLPASLLQRAEYLSDVFDNSCRPRQEIVSIEKNDTTTENTAFELTQINVNNSLEEIIEILPTIVKVQDMESVINKPTIIEHRYKSPIALENAVCVYILHIQGPTIGDILYVGETENLSNRLKQHRMNWRGKNATVRMAAYPIRLDEGGKSKAKQLETLFINSFKKRGYALANVKIGDTVKSQA